MARFSLPLNIRDLVAAAEVGPPWLCRSREGEAREEYPDGLLSEK